jgi:peptidoglycan/xylan/chitin deacetylase (PgdA/CDA1 family)
VTFERGVVTISFDFELIWGTIDRAGPEPFRKQCELERDQVVDRLLTLLEEYEVSATWCVLGHLMLAQCEPVDGRKHPEIVRPVHTWHPGDWFEHDPCSDERSDPIFYGRSLVEKIQDCSVEQEIGCHSFSHVIFGDQGCSREVALSEVSACVRLAQDLGIELRSFAFPRNRPGYLDVLHEKDIRCFRSPEPTWHKGGGGRRIQRLGHLADVILARRPPTVLPHETREGLIDIPASMMYFPMHGVRKHIPQALRVRRARKGVDHAARERRVFHLWTHPTNFADQMDEMLSGFAALLKHVHRLRADGQIEVLTMAAIGERFELTERLPPALRRRELGSQSQVVPRRAGCH